MPEIISLNPFPQFLINNNDLEKKIITKNSNHRKWSVVIISNKNKHNLYFSIF